jgi:hypothetical protein
MPTGFLVKKIEGKDSSKDLGVGRIILKRAI